MKNNCFHRVRNHCSFYNDTCGPLNKMACGHGFYGYVPTLAVVFVGCLLAGLLVVVAVWSDDKQANYDTKKAIEIERQIKALEEEVRKERLYMEHRLDAMDNTVIQHWRRYERLHKGGK